MDHAGAPATARRGGPLYAAAFWLIVAAVVAAVCRYYVGGIDWEEPRVSLGELLAGAAHRPFAYRVLLPGLARATVLALGIDPVLAASAWIYVALLGAVAGLRWLCAAFWPHSVGHDIAALCAPLALLPLTLGFRHTYDLPTLALFTLGLAAMAHRRWRAFLLLYGLGCLSKETTLLLSLVFVLWFARELRPQAFWRLLAMQAGIYLLVRAALLWRFRANPGAVAEYHLDDHLRIYLELPGFAIGYAVGAALIALACARGWREKPAALRAAALALLAVITPLYFVFGFPFEVRIFFEAFAPLYLLCLPLSRRPVLPTAPRAAVP